MREGINRLTGVSWHKERIHRKENDERRYKGRCKFYNYESDDCDLIRVAIGCTGSAHCEWYRSISDEEFKIATEIQEEKGYLIYYAIRQKGYLMDGTEFEKVTCLIVTPYLEDWDYSREEIQHGRTEAYVFNKLYPEYSEYCEISFQNAHGMIISRS